LSDITECAVSPDAVVAWWREFLGLNSSSRLAKLTSGLVTGNRMFLFGQFERDVPGDPPMLRGIADLRSNPGVTEMIWPVMNGAYENAQFGDAETAFVTAPFCHLRRRRDQLIFPISFNRVTASDPSGNRLGEPFYDGYWSCIRKTGALADGDTIEFGANGSRGFSTNATWQLKI
jgi:hypothetical protein